MGGVARCVPGRDGETIVVDQTGRGGSSARVGGGSFPVVVIRARDGSSKLRGLLARGAEEG